MRLDEKRAELGRRATEGQLATTARVGLASAVVEPIGTQAEILRRGKQRRVTQVESIEAAGWSKICLDHCGVGVTLVQLTLPSTGGGWPHNTTPASPAAAEALPSTRNSSQ